MKQQCTKYRSGIALWSLTSAMLLGCGPGLRVDEAVYRPPNETDLAPVVASSQLLVADENVTTRRIVFSWAPATDDRTSSSRLRYAAYLSTTSSVSTYSDAEATATRLLSFTANTTEAVASGLTPGTAYYLNVFVQDEAGNISAYSTESVTTDIFAGGDGSSGFPYQVATLANLNSIRDDVAAYYELTANIDASDTQTWHGGLGFAPLGSQLEPFTGSLNGAYYAISNLHINRPEEDYVGLIAYSTSSLHLRRLKILTASVVGGSYVGALAGYVASTNLVRNIIVGTVSGAGDYVGGVVGYAASGTFTDVMSGVSVSGATYVGGFSGYSGAAITYCGADSNVTSTAASSSDAYVGGFAGRVVASIRYSYAHGNVSAQGNYIGGFLGRVTGAGVVVDFSVATGNVKGGSYIGGFAGSVATSASVQSSLAEGHVQGSGSTSIGGFVGAVTTATVRADLGTGVVFAPSAAAGEAGTFAGRIGAGSTATGNMGRDRSSLSCLGTDSVGTSTCRLVTTGTIRPYLPISFDEHHNFVQLRFTRSAKNLRKVGFADEQSYRISGGCNIEGAAINISGAVTASTTCENLRWTATLNLSAVAQGAFTLTFTQNADAANAKTLNLYKETSFCSTSPVSGAFAGGAGTLADPYTICTADQLQAVGSNLGAGLYFKLMNNIDVSDGFTPIAAGGSGEFRGNFDGNGFAVRNLVVSAETDEQGLFGEVRSASGATRVLNLGVEDARVIGNLFVSPIIGRFSRASALGLNDHYDLYSTGVAIGMNLATNTDGARVGGVMGAVDSDFDSNFTYLFSSATIITHNRAGGGLFGRVANSEYGYLYATGHILGSGDGCGGIVGQALLTTGKFSLSYATGSGFYDTTQNPGSFAGYISGGSIENSYATGHVFGSLRATGFITGLTNGGDIRFCYHAGQILFTTQFNNAGFALELGAGSVISDSFSVASQSISSGGAGFLRTVSGTDGSGAVVTNCYFWRHSWSPSSCIQIDNNTTEADTCINTVTSLSDFMDTTAAGVFTNWTFDNTSGPWKALDGTSLPRLFWEP